MSRITLRYSRVVTVSIALLLALALVPFMPAQPALADSGPVTVNVFSCPDGYDAAGAGAVGDLSANCVNPVAGASFATSHDAGPPGGFVTDAGGAGLLGVVPEGGGTIAETTVGNVGSRVFCSVFPQSEAFGEAFEYDATGNAIAFSIADGEQMHCSWFNYSTAFELIQSEVTIRKYLCPDDYDASTAPDMATLQADCTTQGANIPFSVIPNGAAPVEGATDGSGFGTWTGVAFGPGVVREAPTRYQQSRVFCDFYELGNLGAAAAFSEYPAAGNEIAYDLSLGEGLSCWWFNWDYLHESYVSLTKLACPEGYDMFGPDLATLLVDCATPMQGVTFHIGGAAIDSTDQTDAAGQLSWQVEPGGNFTVTETLPDGYSQIRTFCGTYHTPDGPGAKVELLPEDTSVTIGVDPENSVDCAWFNLPESPGTLIVDKFECLPGYVNDTPFGDLTGECTTKLADIPFILTPDGGAPVQADTDATGQVTFANIDPGPATLDELVPPGYSLVIVYCAIDGGPYLQYTVSQQNVMDFTLGSGETWECMWFNIQAPETAQPGVTPSPTAEGGDTATLILNKYTCPDGFDLFGEAVDPYEDCTLGTDDIVFTLQGSESQLSASTGTGGNPSTVTFSDLTPGDYMLSEELPDNVRFAFIEQCTSDQRAFDDYPFGPFAVIEPDGRIAVSLVSSETLECDWFNVLEEDLGTLILTKYWCDGNVVNEESCAVYTGTIAFRLAPVDGGEDIPFQTEGPDGQAIVDAAGTFELIEEDFEWCFAESDAADESGNIVIESGQESIVDIYNCGPQPLNG